MLSHRQTRLVRQPEAPVVHWCQICGDAPARSEFDFIYCSSHCARAAINADFERVARVDADYEKSLHRLVSPGAIAELVDMPAHSVARDRREARRTPIAPSQES